MLSYLQIPIPSSVNTIQEAEFLLRSTHNLWTACQGDTTIAWSRLEQALEEFTCAEKQLRQAELRAGQARSTIRHSGFEQLLLSETYFPATTSPSGK